MRSTVTASKPGLAIGTGLYSIADATRFTHVPSRKIRGWLNGYGRSHAEPLLHRQFDPVDGKTMLGFLDLVEVRFVNWMIDWGVNWHSIRLVADRARTVLNHDHPFALARFHTDGKAIFLETQEDAGDPKLFDLLKNNFALYDILAPSFRDDIEFGSDGVAAIWRPAEGEGGIVLDPARSFGQPIDGESGVPTATLADAYAAEGSFDRVAGWYDISAQAVRRAVAFEAKLKLAA